MLMETEFVKKRDFCNNAAMYLHQGQNLHIVGRRFSAYLIIEDHPDGECGTETTEAARSSDEDAELES